MQLAVHNTQWLLGPLLTRRTELFAKQSNLLFHRLRGRWNSFLLGTWGTVRFRLGPRLGLFHFPFGPWRPRLLRRPLQPWLWPGIGRLGRRCGCHGVSRRWRRL